MHRHALSPAIQPRFRDPSCSRPDRYYNVPLETMRYPMRSRAVHWSANIQTTYRCSGDVATTRYNNSGNRNVAGKTPMNERAVRKSNRTLTCITSSIITMESDQVLVCLWKILKCSQENALSKMAGCVLRRPWLSREAGCHSWIRCCVILNGLVRPMVRLQTQLGEMYGISDHIAMTLVERVSLN